MLRKAHLEKTGRTGRFEIWGFGRAAPRIPPRRRLRGRLRFPDEGLFGRRARQRRLREDIKVADLARLVCEVVGIEPEFVHDRSKPDGAPQKLMDSGRIRALGWRPRITLETGIRALYADLIRDGGAFS